MAVYVDAMQAEYRHKPGLRRMIMCHMLADSDDELHAMAQRIGVARRWHQKAGTPHSHYDICKSKRALAVKLGAREITRSELGQILKRRREREVEVHG